MTEQNTTQIDDVFARALAKRKAQAAEQEAAKTNSNWAGVEYEDIEIVGLIAHKEIVGRIIGNPVEQRKNATDPKLVLQSSIVKPDKKGYIKINWPIVEKSGKYLPDPTWILTKFYDAVNAGKWVKFADGILKDEKGNVYPPDHLNAKGKNGEWVKSNTRTKIFEEVETNCKIGEKFPKAFYPSKRVVCNWIDRHDTWCKETKHSKILSAKKAPFDILQADGSNKVIYFTDTGIPSTLYDKIFEHCSAVGTMDIDLVITKIEKDYKVFDITDFPKYISEASNTIGVKTRISEEEKQYTLYDLDKLYKVSSYRKLKKHLTPLFKLCDVELGTSFEKELEEFCKIEETESTKDQECYYINEVDNSYGITSKEDLHELIESDINIKEVSKGGYDIFVAKQSNTFTPSVEEQKTEAKRREVKTESVNSDIGLLCTHNFPNWEKLSDDDKNFMLGFITKFEGAVPTYKDNTPLGCSDESCFFKDTHVVTMVPVEVNTCPVCGKYLS